MFYLLSFLIECRLIEKLMPLFCCMCIQMFCNIFLNHCRFQLVSIELRSVHIQSFRKIFTHKNVLICCIYLIEVIILQRSKIQIAVHWIGDQVEFADDSTGNVLKSCGITDLCTFCFCVSRRHVPVFFSILDHLIQYSQKLGSLLDIPEVSGKLPGT